MPNVDASTARTPEPTSDPGVDSKPRVPEKHSTLGLKMADNLPELVTQKGVHVYAADRALANQFVGVVKEYPLLWTDNGLIDIPLDEWMKIPLVEGWQNQKVKARSYPLSQRDREVLNKTFDGLYIQDRMRYANEATPFAYPVFVV